jgi:succinate dehydrogenase / fumarate reductase, membrane anchor subunit
MTGPSGGSAGGSWTPHHREDRIAPVQEREHDRPASLDHPRAPRRPRGIPYFEKYAWLFMRFSGVALVFLALGHLFIGLIWDGGVYRIDFNYVAERWASPFWQIWDMALLWLAMIHGANGMRTIIGDYARKNVTKFYLNSLLLLATGFTLVLGSYVLVTFDANIS